MIDQRWKVQWRISALLNKIFCIQSSSVDNALGSVQETNGVCVWAKDNLGVYYYGMADSIFDAKVNHLTFCDDSDL